MAAAASGLTAVVVVIDGDGLAADEVQRAYLVG
jgi:hypothetical protein